MKKQMRLLLCCLIFVLMASGVSFTAEAATPKKTKLTQDEETHTFSNAKDGSFRYDYAVKSDYYRGVAVDESTKIRYILIDYGDRLWAVVADGDSEWTGSYDTSSYLANMSTSFKPSTTKTVLQIKKNKTGNTYLENGFYYADDYSILTTGFSMDTYYINGAKAKGVKEIDGVYYFFQKGKQVTKTGWYQSGKTYVYVSKKQVKYRFNGLVCYQYKASGKKRVTNKFLTINDVEYRFDKAGNLEQGFQEIAGEYYYFQDGRARINYYKKVGKYGYYFGADGKAVRNTWVKHKKIDRYFAASGHNTRIFYAADYTKADKAGRYMLYKNKKWSYAADGIHKINGVYYYFKKSKLGTTSCWYDKNDTTSYYMKKGTVLYKRVYKDNTYRFYQLINNKWKKAKNIWTPAKKGEIHYYNEDGVLQYKYFTEKYKTGAYQKTMWCHNTDTNRWQKMKNMLVSYKTDYYYAGLDGRLLTGEGWHTIDDWSAVYTDAAGKVSKYIYYDAEQDCSVYKQGIYLNEPVTGLVTVQINGKDVYYLIGESGTATTGSQEIGNYIYDFDRYGRAYTRRLEGTLYWNTDEWMARVINTYLGKTNIPCNVFADQAYALAGGDNPIFKLAVKYTDEVTGGIILDRMYTGTEWGGTATISAKLTLSDGTNWLEPDSVVLNSNVTPFSYDALTPGDMIIYYKGKNKEASHVSLYLGKFENAQAVKDYLVKIGISKKKAEACVKDWGTYYGNDGTYWCIHGGMGKTSQVYISNSVYCIPASNNTNTYARKIVNVID